MTLSLDVTSSTIFTLDVYFVNVFEPRLELSMILSLERDSINDLEPQSDFISDPELRCDIINDLEPRLDFIITFSLGSTPLYRLDISQAQKANETGDERPQLLASVRPNVSFLFSRTST